MSTSDQGTACDPLIQDAVEPSQSSQGSFEDAAVDESRLHSPTLFISCLTICAGVSGLLFGYE
jgi:SP family myo-inositol transporter-like MFS transporter 13